MDSRHKIEIATLAIKKGLEVSTGHEEITISALLASKTHLFPAVIATAEIAVDEETGKWAARVVLAAHNCLHPDDLTATTNKIAALHAAIKSALLLLNEEGA